MVALPLLSGPLSGLLPGWFACGGCVVLPAPGLVSGSGFVLVVPAAFSPTMPLFFFLPERAMKMMVMMTAATIMAMMNPGICFSCFSLY